MLDDPLIQLGALIRDTRNANGLTREDLYYKSKVSVHYIENIESANRNELPEETYIQGFIVKILKALKLNLDILDRYKDQESQYIVQTLINSTAGSVLAKQTVIKESDQFIFEFKIIYVYLLLVAFLLLLFLFITPWNDGHKSSKSSIDRVQKQQDIFAPKSVVQQIAKADPVEEPSIETNRDPSLYLAGTGDKSLRLKILSTAWIQILGVEQNRVLFEGDVFKNTGVKNIVLKDNIGFVVATGNAGAFAYIDKRNKERKLGKRGELIKWYHPKSAREAYKGRLKANT